MKNNLKSRAKIMARINVGVLGASGYTGFEVIKILEKHPKVNLKFLVGDKNRGKSIGELYSSYSNTKLPKLIAFEDINFKDIDLLFSCMPSGKLASILNLVPKKVVLIDLSADFRIQNLNLYQKFYGEHGNKKYINKFIYGLSEINRKKIRKSRLVSCPGCYPTSVLIPLIPLIKNRIISMKDIIVDSKSGVTGAGRNLKQDLLFSENSTSFKAYGEGKHRHIPEMEHQIYQLTSKNINIIFTPHLIPINRGILSTIYVKGNVKEISNALEKKYKNEKFVSFSNKGVLPKISDVLGTNLCKIGCLQHNNNNYVIIVSVIDNLIKGASGQAIQNMNLIFNYPEDLGLDQQPFWP